MNTCVLSCFSHVWLFLTLWTVAHQVFLSMGFSRQEYWVDLLFQGIFLTQGLNPRLLYLVHCRQILYPLSHLGSPWLSYMLSNLSVFLLKWRLNLSLNLKGLPKYKVLNYLPSFLLHFYVFIFFNVKSYDPFGVNIYYTVWGTYPSLYFSIWLSCYLNTIY